MAQRVLPTRALLPLALLGVMSVDGRLTEREKRAKKAPEWKPPNYGYEGSTDELSADLKKQAVDPWSAAKKSKKSNKPILLLTTKPGCPACMVLKAQMNNRTELPELLKRFVFVMADQSDAQSMKYTKKLLKPAEHPTYVPSTMFLRPGAIGAELDITGPNEKAPYFLASSELLIEGMNAALDIVAEERARTQEGWREEIRALHAEHRPEFDGVEDLIAQHEGKLLSLLKTVRAELNPGSGGSASDGSESTDSETPGDKEEL